MEQSRLVAIPLALVYAFATVSAYSAPPQPAPRVAQKPVPTPPPLAVATRPPPPARKASPPRPPPPVIANPMPGEPAETGLGEARLITSSCENYEAAAKKLTEAKIKEMRAAVDESFK